ncbi:MAG: hypothetical protein E7Z91_05580 [Cyanobacteria bacterium SIG30]|nr:hypothetical protein [Cyanobacteria bacterium SIG30]
MTFEVPKISSNEMNFFANSKKINTQMPSFGASHITKQPVAGSKLHQDLNEISNFGYQKANSQTTYGLGGASTPDEGCGQKLWLYA